MIQKKKIVQEPLLELESILNNHPITALTHFFYYKILQMTSKAVNGLILHYLSDLLVDYDPLHLLQSKGSLLI